MECFYHPSRGKIKYNGVDIRELNVRWLRDELGLVSQQPILFDCSIYENIRLGLPEATYEQVVEVAKKANAHNFIMEFPDGYDTSVGQGSTLISGGKCGYWSFVLIHLGIALKLSSFTLSTSQVRNKESVLVSIVDNCGITLLIRKN